MSIRSLSRHQLVTRGLYTAAVWSRVRKCFYARTGHLQDDDNGVFGLSELYLADRATGAAQPSSVDPTSAPCCLRRVSDLWYMLLSLWLRYRRKVTLWLVGWGWSWRGWEERRMSSRFRCPYLAACVTPTSARSFPTSSSYASSTTTHHHDTTFSEGLSLATFHIFDPKSAATLIESSPSNMSADQSLSITSDLRSNAQDSKRDATHKHKWALGAVETVTRVGQKPRPHRPSETEFNSKRRYEKGAVAALASGAKLARKQDMLEGTAVSSSDESAASDLEETPSPPVDAGVMYSFDAARGPSQGSQILHAALNKAVQRFEDGETTKLVKDEYEVLDTEGEIVGDKSSKKGRKSAASQPLQVPETDEDYDIRETKRAPAFLRGHELLGFQGVYALRTTYECSDGSLQRVLMTVALYAICFSGSSACEQSEMWKSCCRPHFSVFQIPTLPVGSSHLLVGNSPPSEFSGSTGGMHTGCCFKQRQEPKYWPSLVAYGPYADHSRPTYSPVSVPWSEGWPKGRTFNKV
nr:hypothetical protein CFP56_16491 [Quercus suber]